MPLTALPAHPCPIDAAHSPSTRRFSINKLSSRSLEDKLPYVNLRVELVDRPHHAVRLKLIGLAKKAAALDRFGVFNDRNNAHISLADSFFQHYEDTLVALVSSAGYLMCTQYCRVGIPPELCVTNSMMHCLYMLGSSLKRLVFAFVSIESSRSSVAISSTFLDHFKIIPAYVSMSSLSESRSVGPGESKWRLQQLKVFDA